MKETPRRKITVTSSLKVISDQLGNRVELRGKGVASPVPPFYSRLLDRYLKTT